MTEDDFKESTQKAKADTVADKHKQNINLLFCDNYRADEAVAVWNANKKGWANFSRLTIILTIILPIYNFTK